MKSTKSESASTSLTSSKLGSGGAPGAPGSRTVVAGTWLPPCWSASGETEAEYSGLRLRSTVLLANAFGTCAACVGPTRQSHHVSIASGTWSRSARSKKYR